MKPITVTLVVAALSLMAGCSQQLSEQAGQNPADQEQENTLTTVIREEKGGAEPSATQSSSAMEATGSVRPATAPLASRTRALHEADAPAVGVQQVMKLARPEVGMPRPPQPVFNTESYSPVGEHGFVNVKNDSLSTFSVDVDTASYSNIRRFINSGSLPPTGAVRIEEMVNYFSYAYPQPADGPIGIVTESGPCPWQPQHTLVRIGIKARDIDRNGLPPSNLVFLIDVSGSMQQPQKLPLLKKAMKLLVEQLGRQDRVAIVVYAGTDRVVLEPTPCDRKETIVQAIDNLRAGGATHGSQGIVTAYQLARQTLMPGGNNRVILASDGDFNVGVTSRGELEKLIEQQRKSGVFLTVLGFGSGNYHDDTMETLADRGNGNYAYIDSLLEAKKVMVREMSGTMFTLAGDVKIQVEFNPRTVGAYRLIGYENRALADEDFNDDAKDAGEVGIGHAVTALYEVIPAGSRKIPEVDPLRYQTVQASGNAGSKDLLTVKVRYKPKGSQESKLLEQSLADHRTTLEQTSKDFRFAAAVAAYGMALKGSIHSNTYGYPAILDLARSGKGDDDAGYRAEFIKMVELTELI